MCMSLRSVVICKSHLVSRHLLWIIIVLHYEYHRFLQCYSVTVFVYVIKVVYKWKITSVYLCVYIYAHTRCGPRGPYAHFLRLLSWFCAHFACYHLLCALFACSESNDIKSLDVAVHKTNAQYLRHALCALSVHLYPPLCSAQTITRTFCVSILCAHIACPSYAAHIAPHCSLYIFWSIIVKIYQKS